MTDSNSNANLDVLRAIAVSTVLVDHFVPTLVYHGLLTEGWLSRFTNNIGQAGVLAFFVHTSLVLMHSMERLERGNGTPFVWRFYLRRFFRIYPLSICCVLVVVLLGIPSSTWKAPDVVTWPMILANLALVQNLVTGKSVIAPLWSLPYEVQMYVVLPLLYLLARKPRALTWLGLLIAAFSILGFILFATVGKLNMATYVPCFLAGVLCYALGKRVRPVLPSALWMPFVLVAVIIYCLVHLSASKPVFWIGWLYCLALAFAANFFHQPQPGWFSRLGNKMATYSYGLYLWHVPVLFLLFHVMPPLPLWVDVPLFVALTALVSIATFHVIEAPLMEFGRKLSSRARPELAAARRLQA